MGELLLRQPIQHIALILGGLVRQKLIAAGYGILPHGGVVTGGKAVGAECPGIVPQHPEFDGAVAQHTGVRCAPRGVFRGEAVDDL